VNKAIVVIVFFRNAGADGASVTDDTDIGIGTSAFYIFSFSGINKTIKSMIMRLPDLNKSKKSESKKSVAIDA
jgi:hypothetical protein